MYSMPVTHPSDGALPPITSPRPAESVSREQTHPGGATASPDATSSADATARHGVMGDDAAEQGGSRGSSMPCGTDISGGHVSSSGQVPSGGEFASSEEYESEQPITGDDELPSGAEDGDQAGEARAEVGLEVPQGDPESIAAIEAMLFGAEDEVLAEDAEGSLADAGRLGLTGVFAGVSDHDLVSALNFHAVRGAQDAALLARIAVLYRRPSMTPVPFDELGSSSKPDSRMPEGRSKAARQARKEYLEAERARRKALRGKTARVRTGGLRPLTRTELMVAELVAQLQVSKYAARRLVAIANALITRLPHTLHALRTGRLDYRRIQIVEGYFTPLLDDHYTRARREGLSPAGAEKAARDTGAALEAYVFPTIWDAHPSTVHQVCAGAVLMVDPEFVERARKEKVGDRFLTYRANGDTGEIYAHLGAAEAQGIFNVVDAYARMATAPASDQVTNPTRSTTARTPSDENHCSEGGSEACESTSGDDMERVCAKVTADLEDVIDASTKRTTGFVGPTIGSAQPTTGSAHPGTAFTPTRKNTPGSRDGETACTCTCTGHRGVNANVNVVMNFDTLLGLNDDPADLTGHGPITADLARSLAFNAGSIWRRLVIDPLTGYLIEYGRTTYRPPVALNDHVKARDHTCRVPGCARPAIKCDGDHVVPYPAGETSASNVCSLCRHHHRLKHGGRWWHQLSTDPAHPVGTVILISPTGHLYLSFPHDYRPLRPNALPDLGPDDLGWAADWDTATNGGWQPRTLADLFCMNTPDPNHPFRHDPNRPDPGPPPF